MITDANPQEKETQKGFGSRQTVEFRCPDGSADIYLLFAGLTVAARHGFEMENALEFAEKRYVDVNIFEEKHQSRVSELQQLPFSCWHSAEALERQRKIYEEYDIFPPKIVNGLIRYLKSFNDQNLRESIKDNEKEIMKLVNAYLHCG
jgi:glutamine synthetase